MTTPLDLELRSRIAAVLAGDVSLRDFYNWLGPATWDIAQGKSPEAARLTYAVEHFFAELSAGDISPREFKRELHLAASTYVAIHTPWNQAVIKPASTENANDIIEVDPRAFVLRKRREAAVA